MNHKWLVWRVLGALLLSGLTHSVVAQTSAASQSASQSISQPSFKLQHMRLEVELDFAKKRVAGTNHLTLEALQESQLIALDGAHLVVQAVRLASGQPLTFRYVGGEASEQDGALQIDLPQALKTGAQVQLQIDYHTQWHNRHDPTSLWGSYGMGVRFMEPTPADTRRRKQAWSFGLANGNRYWMPTLDRADSTSTFDLLMRLDLPLTVVSNGQLTKTITNADGTRTFHWQQKRAQPVSRIAFVAGEYVRWKKPHPTLDLIAYAYHDELQGTKDSVISWGKNIAFFERLTGSKFPHKQFTQVFVQDIGWGIGKSGLAIQSENMVDDARTHDEFKYLWDGLQAETLAQQWFGDAIGLKRWNDAWLTRGFARYFDGLFTQQQNGHDEFLLWIIRADQSIYMADWGNNVRTALVPQELKPQEVVDFVNGNTPFSHGALVLHMLRQQLGEQRWHTLLKTYVTQMRGRTVTTADFAKVVEQVAGEPMGWFFDQWIYNAGHPVFEVQHTYDVQTKTVKLQVKQVQEALAGQAQPRYYRGVMKVAIDQAVHQVQIKAQAQQEFEFAAPINPRFINLDHESTWIKEVRQNRTLAQLLAQAVHSNDVMAQAFALTELSKQYKQADAPLAVKTTIVQAFTQVIGSQRYWRLRMFATASLRGMLSPTFPATDAPAADLPEELRATLVRVIEQDQAWPKAAALSLLSTTRDQRYAPLYRKQLRDSRDRVINAAANALGRTRDPAAFNDFVALIPHPSWKNQSLISALDGLGALGDPRGIEIAKKALADVGSARWTLLTPVWDYPVTATDALVALKATDAAYEIVRPRLDTAIKNRHEFDIFYQLSLLTRIRDKRALDVIEPLKEMFKGDTKALSAIDAAKAALAPATDKP